MDYGDITNIKEVIRRYLDFPANNYSETFLKRRLFSRMNVLRLEDYDKYAKILKEDESEREKLLKNLTIHVTEFYRDPSVWKYLYDKVFPKLKKDNLKIWIAGSSTGQEPYTLAILLLEFLKSSSHKFKFKIIANDIENDVVNFARQGIYQEEALNKVPDFVKDYFDFEDGVAKVKDEVKKLISFEKNDILKNQEPNIDLCFCRNTVIYFTKEVKEKFYSNVYNALNSDSFFVMGRTESLVGASKELFKTESLSEHIFYKN